MELETYLKALQECPDELVPEVYNEEGRHYWRLTAELGIYNNYSILLNADYNRVLRDLKQSTESSSLFGRKYVYAGKYSNKDWIRHGFEDPERVIHLSLDSGVGDFDVSQDKERIHRNRQKQEFNMVICLHPSSNLKGLCGELVPKRVPKNGIFWPRQMVNVVTDISHYAMNQKIPLCLPAAGGFEGVIDPVYFTL